VSSILAAASPLILAIRMVEHHKRFDPAYGDARVRARDLGEPYVRLSLMHLRLTSRRSFFSSYMTQPKSQLHTFRAWAGKVCARLATRSP
jgi:D-galacturonate reductase